MEIKLDENNKSIVQAVLKQSVLTCVWTSDADVYTRGISEGKQHDLLPGYSMLVKPSNLTVRIFSRAAGNIPYSAKLVLKDTPEAVELHMRALHDQMPNVF